MRDSYENNFFENIIQNYLPIEKLKGFYAQLNGILPFEDEDDFIEY